MPDRLCNRISVHVRIRTESDLAGCVRIAEQVHLLDGYPKYLPTDLGRFIASPDAFAAWVAEEQGEIVGHVALHRSTSDAVLKLASRTLNQPRDRLGVIARLLVAPEARRRGIGRLLLETATGESLRRGLWPILDVVTQHSEAIMLYGQAGWIRAGQVTAKFPDGNELEEIVFLGPRPDRTAAMSVSIRDAVIADMERLQGVFERASLSNEHDRGLLLEHPQWLVLSDKGILEGRTRVAVADDEAVVGFATYLISDAVAELEDLFVDPAWRRRGIGEALVADVSARLKGLSFETLEVTANRHAMAFYEHLGFVEVGIVDTQFYPAPRMRRPTG